MTKASVSAISSENNQLDSKREIVQATMAQIDKAHGKGSIMLLGQSNVSQVSAISTGSILIDNATGIGGLPIGRVIEIFGPEASGKTTLALQTIAQSQKNGGICAFIDAEHALDPSYAQALGININDLIISQPDFGEQALDITEMLVRSNALDVIVIDSVAALVPKAEVEGDMGDSHMGLQARLMSQALRKLSPLVNKSKTVIIFINQVRQNIGAMAYAPKETTTGGNALKFYSSMRIEVRRLASLKKDDVHYGNKLIIKIVKNKVAVPFKKVEIDLIFSKGISKELDILDAGLQAKVIQQSGSWFSYEGQKIAQGREQVSEYLLNNPEVSAKIVHSIKQAPAL